MASQREKRQLSATKNRQELIGVSRRDLVKMGLLTSAGYLVAKDGLSARAAFGQTTVAPLGVAASPPVRAFVELLPTPRDGTMPIQTPTALTPAPTAAPNTAAGEGRTITHQAFTAFPPQKFYGVTQKAGQVSVSPDLPLQNIWGFAVGTPAQNRPVTSPGPLYVARYGEPILVRNFNQLPPQSQNGGFGIPSVTTHLHNSHTPSESDGNPCDFFERGFFYDQHYPNVLAGINSTHPGTGDINEAMSTLWYHDHRVDFTAQNVYKGLAGFYLLFNQFDTGNEATGFRLPSFPEFDIPMFFADKVFDRNGQQAFDLFNLDGILGDKFLVNGKIQPVLHVSPRRYRFRWLDSGPSRFYQFFLTDLNNLNAHNLFWQISTDGNLLPKPIQVESVRISVAERADVIIDFAPFAGKTLYLENRLKQESGKGPTDHVIAAAGQGDQVLQIIVDGPNVGDGSANPATIIKFYDLPSTNVTPRVTRTFKFENSGPGWQINGRSFDCNDIRFTVQQNSVERWILINDGGGWEHPIHIHFEEFQTLSLNGRTPPSNSPLVNIGRKDVLRLEADGRATLFFRFRDFTGKYPMHCHNTVHEDHAMMLRWDLAPIGDTKQNP